MSSSSSSPNADPSSDAVNAISSSPSQHETQPQDDSDLTLPRLSQQPPEPNAGTAEITTLDTSEEIPQQTEAETLDQDMVDADAEMGENRDTIEGVATDEAVDATAQDGDSAAATTEPAPSNKAPELKIPMKKDVTLREFLGKMDDYAPIIPDAVTNYYLTLAGLPPPPQTPQHLSRLLALATQKFIADIAADAYQYARIRTGHTTSNTAAANAAAGVGVGVPGDLLGPGAVPTGGAKGKEDRGAKGVQLGVQRAGFGGGGQGGQGQGRTVLTMEDLGMAVGEYGVNVKRGEFYR